MKEKEMIQEVQPKKLNKKGFSLVELIVVIAIMAILVGIVGMAVLPQIENAREAKDLQVISGLCTSATTAFASNAATLTTNQDYTLTLNVGGNTSNPAAAGDDGAQAVIDSIIELQGGAANANIFTLVADDFESRVMTGNGGCQSIRIVYDGDATGVVTVTAHTSDDGTGDEILEAVSSK